MMHIPIRVGGIIADNLMQLGVQSVLDRQPELNLVACAAHYHEFVELYKSCELDVLLWLILPHSEQTVNLVHQFCLNQRTRVLVLAPTFDEPNFYALLKAGIAGYFCTFDDADLLANAIRTLARGQQWFTSTVTVHLLQQKLTQSPLPFPRTPGANLTEREMHILEMVSQGWTNQKIGESLGVTERTVRSHIRNIYDKLHLTNRAEAIAWMFNARGAR